MLILFLAISSGFLHAFEADHLLAVNNIVSSRDNLKSALKDGIYWGLGHTSTIFIVGLLMIVLKFGLSENIFSYFEAGVGLMLMALGAFRLRKLFIVKEEYQREQPHYLAYFVGLVHGLAGSGALVLLLMTQITNNQEGLIYLALFGLGSTMAMLMGATLMSLPYSKALISSSKIRSSLIFCSSVLCFVFGVVIAGENLV